MVYENGAYRAMTPEEAAAMQAARDREEQAYWRNISYDAAVDAQIRKRYCASQEFSVLRQREEKPEEYSVYYAYCEACKAYVKARIAECGEVGE